MKCPHCGKEFNAGKIMGAARSEKKAAASRLNGARVGQLLENAKKLEASLGVSSNGRTTGFEPVGGGSIPSAPAITRQEQPTDKRAIFEKLKAMASAGTLGKEVGQLVETKPTGPVLPFRVQVGDDIWTVVNRGPKYAYEIEEVGTGGFLPEKKVLELWEKRIT